MHEYQEALNALDKMTSSTMMIDDKEHTIHQYQVLKLQELINIYTPSLPRADRNCEPYTDYYCSRCNRYLVTKNANYKYVVPIHKYCPDCGKAIDWTGLK